MRLPAVVDADADADALRWVIGAGDEGRMG